MATNTQSKAGSISNSPFFAALLAETRNQIYSYIMNSDTATLLPYRVDLIAQKSRVTRRSESANRSSIGIVPFSHTMKLLNYQCRSEYLPLFNKKVLDMEVPTIDVVLIDFNCDILLNFLRRITPLGRTRLANVQVNVHMTITINFGDALLPAKQKSSLAHFLDYQDWQHPAATLRYHLQQGDPARDAEVYYFLNIFRQSIYPNNANPDLVMIWTAFQPHFQSMLSESAEDAANNGVNVATPDEDGDQVDGYGQVYDSNLQSWEYDSEFGDGESITTRDSARELVTEHDLPQDLAVDLDAFAVDEGGEGLQMMMTVEDWIQVENLEPDESNPLPTDEDPDLYGWEQDDEGDGGEEGVIVVG
ncbi:hypothetical protein LTR78_009165 [Recurvomyces mirabilis]|uniref:Uncharacterized protein n=1 Tax=Recurvomyces mirabilis TaxID=574656 RepID=A0AAE0TS49_9PEZI|nr:hypothetical protein LTR78_009165 [Recurvomyces mirabilis]KAK5155675.1 hypothetical protein LTS14_005936 [Recurvomyces mirabilis]